MNILDKLIMLDEQLVDWLLHTTPTTPEETREMKRVFALRSRLDGQINTLVKLRLVASTQDLADKAAALDELTGRLVATERRIARATQVIAIAAEVVALAAAVIALAV